MFLQTASLLILVALPQIAKHGPFSITVQQRGFTRFFNDELRERMLRAACCMMLIAHYGQNFQILSKRYTASHISGCPVFNRKFKTRSLERGKNSSAVLKILLDFAIFSIVSYQCDSMYTFSKYFP